MAGAPLILDPALRARVAEICRRDIELPPDAVPAVLDARGGGLVVVRMTGAIDGSCDALEIEADGSVTGAGGGWTMNAERPPAPRDTEITELRRGSVAGGNLAVEGWSVNGQAGAAIAVVQVAVPGGSVVTATLENGWFSAWWPAILPEVVPDRDPYPPVVIQAFDRSGTLVDSATSDEVH